MRQLGCKAPENWGIILSVSVGKMQRGNRKARPIRLVLVRTHKHDTAPLISDISPTDSLGPPSGRHAVSVRLSCKNREVLAP